MRTIANLGTLTAILLAILLAIVSLGSGRAMAEVEYPWCAAYTGKARGVVTCGFVTREQCLATVHGVGGFCQLNPRLAYAPYEPRRPRRVRQY